MLHSLILGAVHTGTVIRTGAVHGSVHLMSTGSDPATLAREQGKCVDLWYEGAGIGVITPIKQPNQGPLPALDNRTLNKLQRGVCCLGERGFALFTQRWRLLQHITAGPARSGISPEPLLFSRTSDTGA